MAPSGMAPMSSWNVWPNGIESGGADEGAPSGSLCWAGLAGRKHAALFVAVKGLSSRLLGGVTTQPSPSANPRPAL